MVSHWHRQRPKGLFVNIQSMLVYQMLSEPPQWTFPQSYKQLKQVLVGFANRSRKFTLRPTRNLVKEFRVDPLGPNQATGTVTAPYCSTFRYFFLQLTDLSQENWLFYHLSSFGYCYGPPNALQCLRFLRFLSRFFKKCELL